MSRIFNPYRVLGLCTSDVPFIVTYAAHSDTHYLVIPVGKRLNLHSLPKLKLIGSSDCLSHDINAIASSDSYIYAASGSSVYVLRSCRYLFKKLEGHEAEVRKLLIIDNSKLLSLDDDGVLNVWCLNTYVLLGSLNFNRTSFEITVLFHPMTYGHKILLGSKQGPLQLWNIKTEKQLYWFQGFNSSVTCIQQAPAMDVCAVGLANGDVHLVNLKYDRVLLHIVHDAGDVSSITFWSCGIDLTSFNSSSKLNDGDLKVILATSSGQLSSWKLSEKPKCLLNQQLHMGCVHTLHVISTGSSAGALVSSGSDNCIKVSYFDRPDGGLRTVYRRAGHFLPPSQLAFWPNISASGGDGGSLVLSAGEDSVIRIFSTHNDSLDKSLGRAYAPGCPDRRKATSDQRSPWLLPAASALDLSTGRADDWDSLVALHCGRRQATSWNFTSTKRGKHWFDPAEFRANVARFKHVVASCVFVTNCGNFVLIGYSTGHLYRFNMQSGLEQGSYGSPLAHNATVASVCADTVNRRAISCADREVVFWSFHDHKALDKLTLAERGSALFARFQSENDMLAIALDSGSIVVVDTTHQCVIRHFANPDTNVCSAMTFSPDGNWLITAHHGDALIKTWDLIDGVLIDCFRLPAPITSLAISPSGDLLATAHANSLGVYLWDNRATYQMVKLQPLPPGYVPARGAKEDTVELPTRSMSQFLAESNNNLNETDAQMALDLLPASDAQPTNLYASPLQLSAGSSSSLTLSGIKPSLLSSLQHLDAIRKRNRDAVALVPKGKTDAGDLPPFFLPVAETDQGLAVVVAEQQSSTSVDLQFRKRSLFGGDNDLLVDDANQALGMVKAGLDSNLNSNEHFDHLLTLLTALGPNKLDLLIRSLAGSADDEARMLADDGATDSLGAGSAAAALMLLPSRKRLHAFLRFLRNRFIRNLDVDLAATCLHLVLTRHADLFISSGSSAATTLPLMSETVEAACQSQASLATARRLTRSLCLTDYIRNPTTALL